MQKFYPETLEKFRESEGYQDTDLMQLTTYHDNVEKGQLFDEGSLPLIYKQGQRATHTDIHDVKLAHSHLSDL